MAHVEACPACHALLAGFEETIAAELFAAPCEHLPKDQLAAVLERLDQPWDAPPPNSDRFIEGVRMPAACHVGAFNRKIHFAPGFWLAWLEDAPSDGWRVFLLRAPSGARFPRHGHRGPEWVCVLRGSFHDGQGWRRPGDFVECGADHEHALQISDQGPCMSLIATRGSLRWKGPAKLLQIIHRI